MSKKKAEDFKDKYTDKMKGRQRAQDDPRRGKTAKEAKVAIRTQQELGKRRRREEEDKD